MKRYNIHLDEEWIEMLEDIRAKVNKELRKKYYWGKTSRADIIRAGLSIAFNLKLTYYHIRPEILVETVKKYAKKYKLGLGV